MNPLTYRGRLWYMLPDVIASVLVTPRKAPTVRRAMRLRGEGVQALHSVRVPAGRAIEVGEGQIGFFEGRIESYRRIPFADCPGYVAGLCGTTSALKV